LRIRNRGIGENVLYSLVWAAIFLIPFMNAHLMSEREIDFEKVIISWGKITPYFIIFVVNNFILTPKLLLKRRYWQYIISLIVVVVAVFATIEISDFRYWQYNVDLRSKASLTELKWYWNVLFSVLMAGANAMIKIYYQIVETERHMAILQKQNVETQMQYLKYQINPHFLMNTLNNIHAMIDFDSDKAKQSVMELSRMMRHVLYDSGESETTLDKEVDFLNNYIALMRLRYVDDVVITLSVPDQQHCRKVYMPPLLLIVLIENAFKHGISYTNPSYINISIDVDDEKLKCLVVNSCHTTSNVNEHSGIGLSNIKKRLDLLFDSHYSLNIDNSNKQEYRVELIIPINR
jgi:sensor histidine kinase YesM